jgi:hypothetical protein
MITIVGHFIALPGKAPELAAALKEAAALAKTSIDAEGAVLVPIGGKISEVLYVWRAASLAQYEERLAKLESSDDFKKLAAKIAPLAVPNTAQWSLYKSV